MSSSSDADGEPPGLPSPRAFSRAVCAAARRRFAASTRSLAPPLPPLGPAPACKESTRRFEAGSTEMLETSCIDNRLKQRGLGDVIGTACVQCSVSRKSLSAGSCSLSYMPYLHGSGGNQPGVLVRHAKCPAFAIA